MSEAPRRRRSGGRPGERARDHGDERGFLTVQYALAVGLSFILLVLVANLLVDLYARAAVRDALEEGTRAVVPVDALPGACADRAHTVLQGLLRGPVGRDIRIRCGANLGVVTATADVRLPSWLPGLTPDWRFTARAIAIRDR
jgi:hypothetical protein